MVQNGSIIGNGSKRAKMGTDIDFSRLIPPQPHSSPNAKNSGSLPFLALPCHPKPFSNAPELLVFFKRKSE